MSNLPDLNPTFDGIIEEPANVSETVITIKVRTSQDTEALKAEILNMLKELQNLKSVETYELH